MWINDGGTFNRGWLKLDGVDYSASYDWDWGDIGAFNIGVTGTYYIGNRTQALPGADIEDIYHADAQPGTGQRSSRCRVAAETYLSGSSRLGRTVHGRSPDS